MYYEAWPQSRAHGDGLDFRHCLDGHRDIGKITEGLHKPVSLYRAEKEFNNL